MRLLDKQITAVKETLEQVKEEYREGERHHWDTTRCPLCNLTIYAGYHKCDICIIGGTFGSCMCLQEQEGYNNTSEISIEDIAGFLMSLLISLEEMR